MQNKDLFVPIILLVFLRITLLPFLNSNRKNGKQSIVTNVMPSSEFIN